ncbi:hypothetical protein FCN80_00940 [Martelella alba]|uniref:Uncharacterized protein n=1 Tax=Martelella alba TaxID=2590451 RepID=A0ABY2SRT3_9HYPH|nr:hypothetical protein FCN80_00940 [Martelella alba]
MSHSELSELRRISAQLDDIQLQACAPAVLDGIASQLDQLNKRMDVIDTAAMRRGGIAGALSGGMVTTVVLLIKTRLGI